MLLLAVFSCSWLAKCRRSSGIIILCQILDLFRHLHECNINPAVEFNRSGQKGKLVGLIVINCFVVYQLIYKLYFCFSDSAKTHLSQDVFIALVSIAWFASSFRGQASDVVQLTCWTYTL